MIALSDLPVLSPETYRTLVFVFSLFPLVTPFQWIKFGQSWYQMGKTSGNSKLNLPGKFAWVTMEVPGFLSLLYSMTVLPTRLGISELPIENKILGSLYVIHYINRAIIGPILNPSMSPIYWFPWAFATIFQFSNGLSIGHWLGGYGPTTRSEWGSHVFNLSSPGMMEFGLLIWTIGILGNIYHDEILRDIRRKASHRQAIEQKKEEEEDLKDRAKKGKKVAKHYEIPQGGLFRYVLYPHYLLEWVEWAGFWMMAGRGCTPARNFLVNEVTTMLARAYEGKQWYIAKFGRERVGGRKAVIPGLI